MSDRRQNGERLTDEELAVATSNAVCVELLETRKAARALAVMIARQDMNRGEMKLLSFWIKDAIEHGADPSEIGQ